MRAVLVDEIGVEFRIAVHQRRCGVEQQAGAVGQRRGLDGAAVRDGTPVVGQHVGGLAELLLDEIDALVVGAARHVHAAGRRIQVDLLPGQYDRTVVLQQDLVQVGDQEVRLARPVAQVGLRDVGNRTYVVQEVVGITDAFVDVVRVVARRKSRGRSPHVEVGVRRGLLRGAVYEALPREITHRSVVTRNQVVAAAQVGHGLRMEQVGALAVDHEEHLFGLGLGLVDVVLRGTALGNDIQEIAGCGREKEG